MMCQVLKFSVKPTKWSWNSEYRKHTCLACTVYSDPIAKKRFICFSPAPIVAAETHTAAAHLRAHDFIFILFLSAVEIVK